MQAGWVLVEVQERLGPPVEDAALLLDEAGQRADLHEERFKLVERCGGRMAHVQTLGRSGSTRTRVHVPALGCHAATVATFDELIEEGASAPIDGWDFTWLRGRAVEERPSWRYFDLVTELARRAERLLDVETGAGDLLADLPVLPPTAVATEAHPPSIARAAPRLRSRGAALVQTAPGDHRLPFAHGSFDLVVSRHPIDTDWRDTARVLAPGGRYISQQVGAHTVRELAEAISGPVPEASTRSPERGRRGAEGAGLVVERLEQERPRTVFYDVGAVVYFLRLVVWIVPDFTVERYRSQLRRLHEHITEHGSFETSASRYLLIARKPS